MGIFGNVGEQRGGGINPLAMRDNGNFHAIVEATKLIQSEEKGMFAIVESTAAEVFDGPYTVGTLYNHMAKKGKHTLLESFVATYVAAYNGVKPGHMFDEANGDEKENNKIWEQKSEELFGVAELVDGKVEYVHDNLLKGAVVHYKIVDDPKFDKEEGTGKRVPRINPETGEQYIFKKVVMLGLVAPDQLSAELREKFADRLHPMYSA